MPPSKLPPPDPSLEPFDNGVGVLTRDGEVAGHIATTRGWFWAPFSPGGKQWWIWYVVVWADGSRENSQEDYPPAFYAVNEMKNGYFEMVGTRTRNGRYDFAWLPAEEAAATRERLGISPADF